jgi:hypothetical protein
VVPLISTLGQIKKFFDTEDVSLPEPLEMFSRLTTYYFETLRDYEAQQRDQASVTTVKTISDPKEANNPLDHMLDEVHPILSKQTPKKTANWCDSRGNTSQISTPVDAHSGDVTRLLPNGSSDKKPKNRPGGEFAESPLPTYFRKVEPLHFPLPHAGPRGVIFRIYDGLGRMEYDVRISSPDLLRRWSLGLRKLMDEEATHEEILLKLDPSWGIDCAAVAWVLEHFPRQGMDVRPDPKTLARHCAVLWKYNCIPDPFKDLGDSMQPRSSSTSSGSVTLVNIDQQSTSPSGSLRCWQERKNRDTCRQLITIATVLGIPEILEDEIKTAVWGTSKKIEIAVPFAIDIEG